MKSTPVWAAFDAQAERLDQRFAGCFTRHRFDYVQPLRLQRQVAARLRKAYTVPVAYTAWGRADAPLLVCLGGVANTAMRFSFLAADLAAHFRIVCMDWLGRGQSGWLADESEYGGATYLEQLRQLLDHLQPQGQPAMLLGSSMGGSVAMALAARWPQRVARLVLNDVGPAMPAVRRRRRADTLARHYVFRSPEDIGRRVGAAQKHDGPVSDEIRHFLAWHQTRWSEPDGGRVYAHDPRAMSAYRRDVQASRGAHDQWADWQRLRGPVLLLHGLESDALLPAAIARMRRTADRRCALTVAHIPATGHTPLLSDRNQTHCIGAWLRGQALLNEAGALSIPLAWPRDSWA